MSVVNHFVGFCTERTASFKSPHYQVELSRVPNRILPTVHFNAIHWLALIYQSQADSGVKIIICTCETDETCVSGQSGDLIKVAAENNRRLNNTPLFILGLARLANRLLWPAGAWIGRKKPLWAGNWRQNKIKIIKLSRLGAWKVGLKGVRNSAGLEGNHYGVQQRWRRQPISS